MTGSDEIDPPNPHAPQRLTGAAALSNRIMNLIDSYVESEEFDDDTAKIALVMCMQGYPEHERQRKEAHMVIPPRNGRWSPGMSAG